MPLKLSGCPRHVTLDLSLKFIRAVVLQIQETPLIVVMVCVLRKKADPRLAPPFLHHTRFRTKGSAGSQRHFLGRTSVFGSTDLTYYATQEQDAQGGSAARGQFPEDKRYPVNVRRKLLKVICKDELSSHNNFFQQGCRLGCIAETISFILIGQ